MLIVMLADFVLGIATTVYSESWQRKVYLELQQLSGVVATKSAFRVATVGLCPESQATKSALGNSIISKEIHKK